MIGFFLSALEESSTSQCQGLVTLSPSVSLFSWKQAELLLLKTQEIVENISRLIAAQPSSLQSFDTQNMETNPSFAFSNYCSVLEMCLSHFWLPWEGGDVESCCILKE